MSVESTVKQERQFRSIKRGLSQSFGQDTVTDVDDFLSVILSTIAPERTNISHHEL